MWSKRLESSIYVQSIHYLPFTKLSIWVHIINWDLRLAERNFVIDECDKSVHTLFCTVKIKHPAERTISINICLIFTRNQWNNCFLCPTYLSSMCVCVCVCCSSTLTKRRVRDRSTIATAWRGRRSTVLMCSPQCPKSQLWKPITCCTGSQVEKLYTVLQYCLHTDVDRLTSP